MTSEKSLSADLDKVKRLWGDKATAEDLGKRKFVNWMVHPYIDKHYINKKISGSSEINWVDYVQKKYISHPLQLGLNLGCGDGSLERYALRIGVCQKFEAFDVAEGGIDIARAEAVNLGIAANITYEVKDINSICLEESKYDIGFASMSAHHIGELEHVFSEVRKALKPSGVFVLNEFVGPTQFQWTDQQLVIMNDLLEILPGKYRTNISSPGHVKDKIYKPSVTEMNSYDPSEAIRSAEIIPLLPRYFNILEKIDYGGTILHILLQDIVGNFDPENEEDLAILKLLTYFEEILIRSNVLPSDFALIVAQKGARSCQSNLPHSGYDCRFDHLSGEQSSQQLAIQRLIKTVGLKIAAKLGFRL
jgi:SAM-dependent methyltransferase